MDRIQGGRHGPSERSQQTGQEWARLVTPGKLELGPWSRLKPVDQIRLRDLQSDVDVDVLIDSASTGVSFWEGAVPDPVDPQASERDGRSAPGS